MRLITQKEASMRIRKGAWRQALIREDVFYFYTDPNSGFMSMLTASTLSHSFWPAKANHQNSHVSFMFTKINGNKNAIVVLTLTPVPNKFCHASLKIWEDLRLWVGSKHSLLSTYSNVLFVYFHRILSSTQMSSIFVVHQKIVFHRFLWFCQFAMYV